MRFGPWSPAALDANPRFDGKGAGYIPLTATVHPLKRRSLAKLSAFARVADTSAANRLDDNGSRERGIVTAGLPYLSVLDALEGVERKPDILKLGGVHPLPRGLVKRFLETHEEVKVIEELYPFLEHQIKATTRACRRGLSARRATRT